MAKRFEELLKDTPVSSTLVWVNSPRACASKASSRSTSGGRRRPMGTARWRIFWTRFCDSGAGRKLCPAEDSR